MNRFHVHLNVADLAAGIRFYNELFGADETPSGEAQVTEEAAATTES